MPVSLVSIRSIAHLFAEQRCSDSNRHAERFAPAAAVALVPRPFAEVVP